MDQQPSPASQEKSPGQTPQQEGIFDDLYDNSMEGYDKPIRRARILLFIIAALQLVGIVTIGDIEPPDNWIYVGVFVGLAVTFAALAFWTKRKPYTAILTALVIYGSLNLLAAIIDPASIFRGIILKIVAFVLLINALKNAREVQEWLDQKSRR